MKITPVIAKAQLAVSRAVLLAAMGFEEAKNVQGMAVAGMLSKGSSKYQKHEADLPLMRSARR